MTGENVPFCRFVWKYILNDGKQTSYPSFLGVNFWYRCTKFCYICWFFVHVLPGQSWLKQAKVDFNSKLLHGKSLSILLALTVEQPTWEAYSTKIA